MKYDLVFEPSIMNAAGSLGFAPDPHGPVDLARLGAFVTNPISLAPRDPATGPRCLSFPGGFLLHTGYPNPGLSAVLRQYAAGWRRAPLPVLVNILVENERQVSAMVMRLEEVGGIAGIELGVPPWADAELVVALAEAAIGELPIVLRLPFERASEIVEVLVRSRTAADGIAAVSLAAPRGALPSAEGGLVTGRLYGPALFPLALVALRTIAAMELPVIAAGGIYNDEQIDIMLSAGAHAVQLDAWLWRGGIRA